MAVIKQLFLILGLAIILSIVYSTFSTSFQPRIGREQFNVIAPGQIVHFSGPLQPAPQDKGLQTVEGYVYFITFERNSIFYLENFSIHANAPLTAYLSTEPDIINGSIIGAFTITQGNLTLYVPPDLSLHDASYFILWSDQAHKIVAYANLTAKN